MIYLDNAATSFLKPPTVYAAVQSAMRTMASPGRGGHAPAMRAADTVYQCRERAAALFHMEDATHVVFTMNATHALNIAIRTLVGEGDPVVISGFEHNAVTRPLHAVGAELRVASGRLFDREAVLEDFRRLLPGAKAAVCTHVSNVFGFVLPIQEIAQICHGNGVPLIVDAAQSAGILELDVLELDAAFVAMPGHKGLLGPQGTGLLLCKETPEPLLCGGTGVSSMEQAMPELLPERAEAGTHNVPGIAGLSAGIGYVAPRLSSIHTQERKLLQMLSDGLRKLPALEVFCDPTGAAQTSVVSVRSRDMDCEELAYRLAQNGVAVRAGLHCAPCAHETVGTLETGTVRFSLSPFTTEAEIQKTLRIMRQIVGS